MDRPIIYPLMEKMIDRQWLTDRQTHRQTDRQEQKMERYREIIIDSIGDSWASI